MDHSYCERVSGTPLLTPALRSSQSDGGHRPKVITEGTEGGSREDSVSLPRWRAEWLPGKAT